MKIINMPQKVSVYSPRSLLFGLAAVALATACSRAGGEAPQRAILRVSPGTAARFADALKQLDDVAIEYVQGGGSSVTSLEQLQDGATDVGVAMADVAYLTYAGQLSTSKEAFANLRGIAVLDLNTVHLLAGRHATVTGIGDLRGLNVAIGPPRSATLLLVRLLLEAAGISSKDLREEIVPYTDAADRLTRGTLDAAFMTQVPPAAPVIASLKGGARLIAIDGERIERLRHDYPYLQPTLIPASMYEGTRNAVHTIGVDLLLVCRADLPDRLIYRLTEAYFLTLGRTVPAADLERAPAMPIPLHAGAARYYRQRELSR